MKTKANASTMISITAVALEMHAMLKMLRIRVLMVNVSLIVKMVIPQRSTAKAAKHSTAPLMKYDVIMMPMRKVIPELVQATVGKMPLNAHRGIRAKALPNAVNA
jgi:hypothetical protein